MTIAVACASMLVALIALLARELVRQARELDAYEAEIDALVDDLDQERARRRKGRSPRQPPDRRRGAAGTHLTMPGMPGEGHDGPPYVVAFAGWPGPRAMTPVAPGRGPHPPSLGARPIASDPGHPTTNNSGPPHDLHSRGGPPTN